MLLVLHSDTVFLLTILQSHQPLMLLQPCVSVKLLSTMPMGLFHGENSQTLDDA